MPPRGHIAHPITEVSNESITAALTVAGWRRLGVDRWGKRHYFHFRTASEALFEEWQDAKAMRLRYRLPPEAGILTHLFIMSLIGLAGFLVGLRFAP